MEFLKNSLFLKIFISINVICILLNIALYYFVDFKNSLIEALDKKDIFIISLAIIFYIFLTILLYFVLELRKKLKHF
ncbi:hypothetical protein [Campylobacter sp.]|uniref:hypothetical protein n=1 Tax=Campylobacter sp. TaxID=205 RepID=UPI002A7FD42D|nr:hypothetical protein [Campylobacter sp.]MCI6662525.1 hypothetical protein [Campylobacter sp.]MDY4155041.1 hypothetical protein [Campylobacter sp.]